MKDAQDEQLNEIPFQSQSSIVCYLQIIWGWIIFNSLIFMVMGFFQYQMWIFAILSISLSLLVRFEPYPYELDDPNQDNIFDYQLNEGIILDWYFDIKFVITDYDRWWMQRFERYLDESIGRKDHLKSTISQFMSEEKTVHDVDLGTRACLKMMSMRVNNDRLKINRNKAQYFSRLEKLKSKIRNSK